MEKELVYTAYIKNYPRRILLTASKAAKYFKPTATLAKKYLTNIQVTKGDPNFQYAKGADKKLYYLNETYEWKKKGTGYRLYDKINNVFIIKNPNEVGKERWLDIKGQDIFGQVIHEFTRKKLVTELKKFWEDQLMHTYPSTSVNLAVRTPTILSLQGSQYPVSLHFDYKAKIIDSNDLDNYSLPYHKTLIDSLVKCKIIRGDTIKDVDGIKLTYTPLEESNMDQLVQNWGKEIPDTLTIKIYAYRI